MNAIAANTTSAITTFIIQLVIFLTTRKPTTAANIHKDNKRNDFHFLFICFICSKMQS